MEIFNKENNLSNFHVSVIKTEQLLTFCPIYFTFPLHWGLLKVNSDIMMFHPNYFSIHL